MRRGVPKQRTQSIHQYFTRASTKEEEKAKSSKSIETRKTTDKMASSKEKEVPTDQQATEKEITLKDVHQLILAQNGEIKSVRQDVAIGFGKLDEKVDKMAEKLSGLEVDVAEVTAQRKEDKVALEDLKAEVKELKRSLLSSQVHSRKYHLNLYGVGGFEATPQATIQRVRKFAKEDLQLIPEYVDKMVIRNAHRLQKRDTGETPIVIVFLHWADRESFLKESKNLKGTGMSVRSDLPPELKIWRGKLAKEAYTLRKEAGLHTRIREKGPDVWLETKEPSSVKWNTHIPSAF